MKNNISVIVTLFRTPFDKIKNLNQYKNFNMFIFQQEKTDKSQNILKKKLNFKFNYFGSRENIGLGRASNFLLNQVKSNYCLFTQPDIRIKYSSVLTLKKIIEKNKKAICISPSSLRVNKKNLFEIKDKIDFSCILIDVKKMKKIGFFDEDYFLYWEDIDLMNRIRKSKYHMLKANNVYFQHYASTSSKNNNAIKIIRNKNYIYGELLYDFKNNKLRIIKIFRKIFQNLFLIFFYILIFRIKDCRIRISKLFGINKFVFFYFKKKLIK